VVTTDIQTAAFNLTHTLHSELAALIYSLYLRVATVYTVYTCLLEPFWLGIELSRRLFTAIEFARIILAKVMKIVRQLEYNCSSCIL
jgi:hypothetical protein